MPIISIYIFTYESPKAYGDVAQTVERSLCMREVRGSIPRISIFSVLSFLLRHPPPLKVVDVKTG